MPTDVPDKGHGVDPEATIFISCSRKDLTFVDRLEAG